MKTAFEDRCEKEPQEVIKTLLNQITRQAKKIAKRNETISFLNNELTTFLFLLKKIAPLEIITKFEKELIKKNKKRRLHNNEMLEVD